MFGTALGERITSLRREWKDACQAAGLQGFQLRDLRHEGGSRFDEAGMPINYVSKMLGHASLTTTSRYLNIQRRGLHREMEKFEQFRKERFAKTLQTDEKSAAESEPPSDSPTGPKPLVS